MPFAQRIADGGRNDVVPPIEPSTFDLIVTGTGTPESIIAAAASSSGKTVLHLDTDPFYGAHYASLHLNDLITFLQSPWQPHRVPESDGSIPLVVRSLYSSLEISSHSDEPLKNARGFNLDLAGPRVFLCSDSMIDFILKTGINQYMEFKSVDASFAGDRDGGLLNVPDSRSAIFKDRSLSITEKNRLMKFFKLVQAHFSEESVEDWIPEEDLESPFVDFLSKIGLSQKLKLCTLFLRPLSIYFSVTDCFIVFSPLNACVTNCFFSQFNLFRLGFFSKEIYIV